MEAYKLRKLELWRGALEGGVPSRRPAVRNQDSGSKGADEQGLGAGAGKATRSRVVLSVVGLHAHDDVRCTSHVAENIRM